MKNWEKKKRKEWQRKKIRKKKNWIVEKKTEKYLRQGYEYNLENKIKKYPSFCTSIF